MEKILFSLAVRMMFTKNICSLKPFPYPFSQTHTDSMCYLLWITAPQDKSHWEGACEVSAPTSCSQQVGSENRPGCSGLHPVEAWKPLRMKCCFLPQNICDFHVQERQRGRREAKSQKGLGPYRGLVTEPGAKAWSLALKLSQEKPTNCSINTDFM